MRLYLRPSERRPQPEPIQTNDALAFTVGIALWMLALGVVALHLAAPDVVGMPFAPLLAEHPRPLLTVLLGLGLGVVGLLASRRRAPRR